MGFLYPNDESGRGRGHVSYTVRHGANLPSGTQIHNMATIVFDYNDPIETPVVLNTLDAMLPASAVLPLPARVEAGVFKLEWSGSDDAGGSGIAGYDVYVSIDDGPFVILFERTPYTFGNLEAQLGHTFAFYSVAIDNAGHVEEVPKGADEEIVPDAVISTVAPVAIEAGSDLSATEGDLVSLPGAIITFPGEVRGLKLVIDWGDGTVEDGTLTPIEGGAAVSSSHRYADDGIYTITFGVTGEANTTACDSLRVTVQNAPPSIVPQPALEARANEIFTLAVVFTDAGAADVHTATINWGDGSPLETVKPSEAAGGQVVADHAYRRTGLFTITVTVTDDGGASDVENFAVNIIEGIPIFRRGDVDGSGTVDISDPINNLFLQFLGTFDPTCKDALDDDDSGAIDIADPIFSLTSQFIGGPPQPAPGPNNCSIDPTRDKDDLGNPGDLGCDSYSGACN
ncbi:MAG: PKD domain-containing protein [Planctomycetes bacterium]|nr:PKD domain-containing protein [Planctomycetota bacterium]